MCAQEREAAHSSSRNTAKNVASRPIWWGSLVFPLNVRSLLSDLISGTFEALLMAHARTRTRPASLSFQVISSFPTRDAETLPQYEIILWIFFLNDANPLRNQQTKSENKNRSAPGIKNWERRSSANENSVRDAVIERERQCLGIKSQFHPVTLGELRISVKTLFKGGTARPVAFSSEGESQLANLVNYKLKLIVSVVLCLAIQW